MLTVKTHNMLTCSSSQWKMPILQSTGLEGAIPNFFKAIAALPHKAQVHICRLLAESDSVFLKDLVNHLQQLIAVEIMSKDWSQSQQPNENIICSGATRLMRLVYYATMLLSRIDNKELLSKEKKHAEENLQQILQG